MPKKIKIFTEKHVYQRPETVHVYEDSHYVKESIKKRISKQILELLCEGAKRSKPLRILDAGIGGGRLILLPLLDAAIKKNIPLEIIGIDNSKAMINDLRGGLKAKGFNVTNGKSPLWLEATKNNCSIKAYNYDLEDHVFVSKISEINKQFDAVISVLTLHHSKNWRLSLLPLVQALKKDGFLILFEWTKGIKLRDGNFIKKDGKEDRFEDINTAIVDFWKSFYRGRCKYHLWFPEIMASDYSKVADVLKAPFFNQMEFVYSWDESKDVTWGTLKNWIIHRAYSNFHRGLSEEHRNELIQMVNEYYKKKRIDLRQPTNDKLGARIRMFKKQCELPDFEKAVILDSIIKSSLHEKLIYEDKEHYTLLDLASILLQHDAMTNNTLFFTINLWDILTGTWSVNEKDKPMVFNIGVTNPKFLGSVLLYYAAIERLGLSATAYIFREMVEKPAFIINKTKDFHSQRLFLRNLRTKMLQISLPESLLNKDNEYLTSLLGKAEALVQRRLSIDEMPDGAKWKPLKEDVWNLALEHNRVKKVLDELKQLIDDDKLASVINEANYKKFVSALKPNFEAAPNLLQMDKNDNLFKEFCKILVFHLIIQEWDSMIYIPSEMLLEEESKKVKAFGFGGLIIAEKNNNDQTLKHYLERRVEMLRIAINMKFRGIGAGQWAMKQTKDVRILNKLLTDFQHIMLNNILQSLYLLIERIEDKTTLLYYANSLHSFLDVRKDFLADLAEYLTYGFVQPQDKEDYEFDEIKNSLLFINLPFFRGSAFKDDIPLETILDKWRDTFQFPSAKFKAYSGVVEAILENLIFNSITKGFRDLPAGKSCSETGSFNGVGYFVYWDTGIGFKIEDFGNIERWLKEGPNEREGKQGLGYWLIARCIDYNSGDLKICAFTKDKKAILGSSEDSVLKKLIMKHFSDTDKLKLRHLDENLRVLHWIFEADITKKGL